MRLLAQLNEGNSNRTEIHSREDACLLMAIFICSRVGGNSRSTAPFLWRSHNGETRVQALMWEDELLSSILCVKDMDSGGQSHPASRFSHESAEALLDSADAFAYVHGADARHKDAPGDPISITGRIRGWASLFVAILWRSCGQVHACTLFVLYCEG